jgi:hypothetical protein
LGSVQRPAPVSLHGLSPDVQCADRDVAGPSAPQGPLAGPGSVPDVGKERGESRRALWCRLQHGFPLAPSFSGGETFILESFKGKRVGLPRPSRTRGGKPQKPGLSAEQIPVLVARDRTGATIDAMLPKLDRASVTAVLAGVVTPANQLCCDGGKAIAAFARVGGIPYHILAKPGGPKPEAPELHINNVNAYHSRLKEWLRPFHGVATKNLPHYLGWRRTLEAFGRTVSPAQWLNRALGMGGYQQLTI